MSLIQCFFHSSQFSISPKRFIYEAEGHEKAPVKPTEAPKPKPVETDTRKIVDRTKGTGNKLVVDATRSLGNLTSFEAITDLEVKRIHAKVIKVVNDFVLSYTGPKTEHDIQKALVSYLRDNTDYSRLNPKISIRDWENVTGTKIDITLFGYSFSIYPSSHFEHPNDFQISDAMFIVKKYISRGSDGYDQLEGLTAVSIEPNNPWHRRIEKTLDDSIKVIDSTPNLLEREIITRIKSALKSNISPEDRQHEADDLSRGKVKEFLFRTHSVDFEIFFRSDNAEPEVVPVSENRRKKLMEEKKK